jgi:hypothetical protein
MARPIEPTPVLEGKDAREFLDQIKVEELVSAGRSHWLEKLAQESKSVEK